MYKASDGTTTLRSSTHEHQLDRNDDIESGYDDHHPHQAVNLSRLSVCSNSCMYGSEHNDIAKLYEIDAVGGMSTFMSQLSIESFEGDADDEEFSDEKKNYKSEREPFLSSSDSEPEPSFYSLPATPPRIRRSHGGLASEQQIIALKDYASENEAKKCTGDGEIYRRKRRRRRRIERHGWLLNGADNYYTARNDWMNRKGGDNVKEMKNGYSGGESESGGVMLMARPKGGRRSLWMDFEEVKACRDLGFELEHERMLEMPSRVSISAVDTSSGGSSPLAHWRISSPG